MPAIGLNHINIRTSFALLEQVRDFYRDALGLVQGERPPFQSQGFWMYAGTAPIVHLSGTKDGETRRTTPESALDHLAFSCTGIAQMQTRLQELGIDFSVEHVPERRQVQLFCRDPAGNGVELNFENQ
jgi:catechol 2,3-dioxygenase-like lactoylglutathione lyase family enzyme